ncbi:hypothetical protein ACXET9_14535 [Brachybacterium sp. DNPG3]
MFRIIAAIAWGAALAALAIVITTGSMGLLWVAIVGFIVALPLTIGSLSGLLLSDGTPKPAAVERARAEGGIHAAGVLSLRRTGLEINGVDQYEVELLVDARDHAAYRTTLRRLLDLPDLPRWQVGSVLAVVRLAPDAPNIAVVDEQPPPMRTGLSPDAPQWERDVDQKVPGVERPLIPVGRRFRATRRLLFATVGVASFSLVSWPWRGELEAHVLSLLDGEDLASYLRGPERAADALASLEGEIGTTVTSVLIYDGWMEVDVPTAPGATTYDTLTIRGGRIDETRPATIQPEQADEFDLSEVDWTIIPTLFTTARDQLGFTDDDMRGEIQHASASRSTGTTTQLRLSVYLNTPYANGSLHADAQGTVLETP